MIRDCFWVCLFVLFLSVYSNDDREFAIKLANCRRVCLLKYPASSTCPSLCTLHRACSLHSCPLFCESRDPDICLDTCHSFTDSLLNTCHGGCEAQPNVSVSESGGGIASLEVSVDLPKDTLSHVIILKQINSTSGTRLTYDTSLELRATFSGIYPWFEYEIEAVLMNATSCCKSKNVWNGKVIYNVNGPLADEVNFYPYPLPPTWINEANSGRISSVIEAFPEFIVYDAISHPTWVVYSRVIVEMEVDLEVQSANLNMSDKKWKGCHLANRNENIILCVQYFGMGYLFKESLSPGEQIPIHDSQTQAEIRNLKIRPRTTCRYFPNINQTLSLTLKLGCGTTNTTTATVVAQYHQDKILIKACFMSSTVGGGIDRLCCDDKGLSCFQEDGERTLNLILHRTYLFYFLHDPDKIGTNNTCKYEKPCDGFYQRITTPEDITECADPTDPPSSPTLVISLSVSFSAAFVVVALVMSYLLWKLRCHTGPEKKQREIPNDMDALLGGELPRDAISKERYVDRGNFGYIFEGKLKVKLNDTDELTRQYEVALKILKSKVDETENSTTTQDNIKDAKKAMKAEIHTMKQIQNGRELNRNILRMYGYVVDAPPYILVLELCASNLTRYLRQIRVQIDNKTLSPEDVQIGTTLSLEDHRNSVTREGSRTSRDVAREGSRTSRDVAREGSRTSRDVTREGSRTSRDRTEGRLVSQSGQENTLSLLPPRTRVLSRSTQGNMSAYNDSQHGRMTRQVTSMERFRDTVLTTANLMNFCWQVSYGMDYLHSIDLIHRDLAADNVLLKEEANGSLTLKICDFGQSRMLYNGKYVGSGDSVVDRQRMFRLRWTSPEIKKDPKSWSKSSDVWSYGVFMWEVFTLGGQPYPGWPDHHVLDNLLAGLRMKQPPCCNDQAWAIATRCWNSKPELRGEFNEIKDKLDEIMLDEQDKELGIQRSDYTFCDVPEEESRSEEDVDLMDTDHTLGPLDLDNPTFEGTFSHLNSEWVVIGNQAAEIETVDGRAQRRNDLSNKGLKVSLDVADGTIRLCPDDIAQF